MSWERTGMKDAKGDERVDTGLTIVGSFLDLRGDQLQGTETNTGQIVFKC